MKNYTIAGIGALVIILALAYFMRPAEEGAVLPEQQDIEETPAQEVPVDTMTGVAVVRGTVVEVDKDQIAVDEPYRFVVESADGTRSIIAVPSMGLQLCAAYTAGTLKDVNTISVGNEIEVAGSVGEGGVIIPCDSKAHYIR